MHTSPCFSREVVVREICPRRVVSERKGPRASECNTMSRMCTEVKEARPRFRLRPIGLGKYILTVTAARRRRQRCSSQVRKCRAYLRTNKKPANTNKSDEITDIENTNFGLFCKLSSSKRAFSNPPQTCKRDRAGVCIRSGVVVTHK